MLDVLKPVLVKHADDRNRLGKNERQRAPQWNSTRPNCKQKATALDAAAIGVHGWGFAVDPPLSFDRSRAVTGSARPFPVPELWSRRLLHLVSSKTA